MCDITLKNGLPCQAQTRFWIQSLVTKHNKLACSRHLASSIASVHEATRIWTQGHPCHPYYSEEHPKPAHNSALVTVKVRDEDGNYN